MSLQTIGELGNDVNVLIFTTVIESPKEYTTLRIISKEWKETVDKVIQTILKEFKKPAGAKESDIEYFLKLYSCISTGGIYFGRRGVHTILPYKTFLRFARELERGEGHTPKTHYFIYTYRCKGYAEMDCERPEFASTDPNVAITPLNYFRQMEDLAGAYGVPGPKQECQKIYYALFENRQKTHPNDEQLNNSRFGELAFYDDDKLSSTPAEKAAAIVQFIQDKFHEHLATGRKWRW